MELQADKHLEELQCRSFPVKKTVVALYHFLKLRRQQSEDC